MTTQREAIYDAEISPLMRQIIALCKAHDIPVLASFQINDDRPDGPAFLCTTAVYADDACKKIHDAREVLKRRDYTVALFTIVTKETP